MLYPNPGRHHHGLLSQLRTRSFGQQVLISRPVHLLHGAGRSAGAESRGLPLHLAAPSSRILLPAFPLKSSVRLGAVAAVLYVLLILLEDAEYVNLGWELVMAPCALFFPALWGYLLVTKAL
jgi:hypothetical protein